MSRDPLSEHPTDVKEATLLVIEDNPDDVRLLANFVGDLGRVVFASTGEEGIRMAGELRPDLILLDIELPDILGPAVFKRIQAKGESAVIFVTSHGGATHQVAALASGAVDFITKPFDPRLIRASIQEQLRRQAARRAQLIPKRDRITQVFNRQYFDEQLERLWQEQTAAQGNLALALVHVDYLRDYGDNFGSLKADACLKNIARAFDRGFHTADELLARFGAEKFALLVPGLDEKDCREWGQWLVETVRSLAIPHGHSPISGFITVSVGVQLAQPRAGHSAAELVEGAYAALSQSRVAGHNRSCVQV